MEANIPHRLSAQDLQSKQWELKSAGNFVLDEVSNQIWFFVWNGTLLLILINLKFCAPMLVFPKDRQLEGISE